MFGDDFYPTPGVIAAKMLQKVHREAVYFLEPSAGKGDLAKAILGFGRERGSRFGSGSRHRVDVIELHPDLLSVLHAHEDLTVVGHDWLSYDGVSLTFPRFYRHLHKEENNEIGGQHGSTHTTSVSRGV